ncbi:hypothetical protein PENSPDRAFT_200953 [Peniophora sp. CONT]|nr:hypothetical protein PENSPDRAFT_200953 [Peniophora sp. CONT]
MSTTEEPFIIPTDEDVILYHQVWRALLLGSPRRPSLPLKLVRHISTYCRWVLPDRVHEEKVQVRCISYGTLSQTRWFAIAPPTDGDLRRLAAIQLLTIGKDQGWANYPEHGSYSWYEVRIGRLNGGSAPAARWRSHYNELCGRAFARSAGPLHPVHVEEWGADDVIGVWACAQFRGWSNTGEAAELRFYKWFQPVIPLGD